MQDVVITVPALLDDTRRRTIEEAAELAGLSVTCLLSAPSAAALAYGLDSDDETVLVFDLGAATLGVCIAEIDNGVVEIKAVSGDHHLGGDDWDQRIVEHLLEQFRVRHGVNLAEDPTEVSINLPHIAVSAQGPLHLDEQLTRAESEQLTADLLERCKAPVDNVIKDAGIRMRDIDHAVLVGRATRMPAVADLLEKLTGKAPRGQLRPETAPAVGAALRAGITKGEVLENPRGSWDLAQDRLHPLVR